VERDQRIALDEVLERALDRKRTNFLEDYGLKSKPALIWQAWPTAHVEVDLSEQKLQDAMRKGGGPTADEGWWNGFQFGWWPRLVFDGLTSESEHGAIGWATEIHVDGHIAAGVWTFPEATESPSPPQLGVAEFYTGAFRDFSYLATQILSTLGVSGTVHATVTMHMADKLAWLAGRGRVTAPAPKRKTLRWPIVESNVADLAGAGSTMAAQFLRTYGRKPPAA